MEELSHVGMGVTLCPICGKQHDEVVLLDRRLKATLPRTSLMGRALCPDCESKKAEYIAMVVISNKDTGQKTLKPEDAKPTGIYAHVRREAAKVIFNIPIPDDCPLMYCGQEVIDRLKEMEKRSAA
jgi:RNA polymerase subunit RPABC4/transcription elongation factor Spt4